LYMSGLQLSEAREELVRIAAESPDVTTMIEFLEQAQRPIVR